LIRGFLVKKRALELPLPWGVGLEAVTLLGGTDGLNAEQFPSEIAHSVLGLFLGLGPASAPDGAQLRLRLARADVFAHEVSLAHGHVQTRGLGCGIARGVLDDQALLATILGTAGRGRPGRRERLETAINPDAVLQVHDEIALVEIGEIDFEGAAKDLGVGGFETSWGARPCSVQKFRRR
jgi:hypothetical protein